MSELLGTLFEYGAQNKEIAFVVVLLFMIMAGQLGAARLRFLFDVVVSFALRRDMPKMPNGKEPHADIVVPPTAATADEIATQIRQQQNGTVEAITTQFETFGEAFKGKIDAVAKEAERAHGLTRDSIGVVSGKVDDIHTLQTRHDVEIENLKTSDRDQWTAIGKKADKA